MANELSESKKRGLGRGLSALFVDDEEFDTSPDKAVTENSAPSAGGATRRMMGLDQLTPGEFQPRKTMDDEHLKELAASIAVHGVLQPIIVRPLANGKHEIIAGERRWRAAQKAQLHEVPVIIKDMNDEQAAEIALIENLQREDLNALEEAQGYKRLMDEFGHTQEKLAAGLGKSRSHIANMTRLLTLPNGVQNLIRDGKLSAGHARALITAENPEELAKTIVLQGFSVRETEKLAAASAGKAKKAKARAPIAKDIDTLALEKDMTGRLGLKVSIDMKGDGKGGRTGQISIAFKDLDQLDSVLRLLSR